MEWIKQYQLFLFDFDGLLVNTEELHFAAYQKVCKERGFHLHWDWTTYAQAAHYKSHGIKEKMYLDFPELQAQEPNWDVLYAEKKRAYLDLLYEARVRLMPGVEPLLEALQRANIKRCVVTHSPKEQIQLLREQLPLLNTLPIWITREQYLHPKPHSECYEYAIAHHGSTHDKIIGFEDSPRGLQALLGTKAKAVLVSQAFDHIQLRELAETLGKPFEHTPRLDLFEICQVSEEVY